VHTDGRAGGSLQRERRARRQLESSSSAPQVAVDDFQHVDADLRCAPPPMRGSAVAHGLSLSLSLSAPGLLGKKPSSGAQRGARQHALAGNRRALRRGIWRSRLAARTPLERRRHLLHLAVRSWLCLCARAGSSSSQPAKGTTRPNHPDHINNASPRGNSTINASPRGPSTEGDLKVRTSTKHSRVMPQHDQAMQSNRRGK
jgi:hypothetical protein